MDKADLTAIRAKIDALDTELRDILYRRAQVVAQVASIKEAATLPIRIWREAAQLAEIVAWQKTHPEVPLPTLLAIWREVIGASLAQQGDIEICADAEVAPLARAYFGAAVTYCGVDAPHHHKMVRVVAPAQCPISKDKDENEFVFMRLPLIGQGCAFCYGSVPQEKGTDDVTLIRSAEKIETCVFESETELETFYFCEVSGAHTRDDIKNTYNAVWLGVYPRPLVLEGGVL
ncbi:MAG: chorismate mutase [Alphaproteobacteria bacterium]|nr:chorismate mutase [Alphaproteobacteria bacterium]